MSVSNSDIVYHLTQGSIAGSDGSDPISDPDLSLGGYRSSVKWSDNQEENVFDFFTFTEAGGITVYRCIAVNNEGTDSLTEARIFFPNAPTNANITVEFGIQYNVDALLKEDGDLLLLEDGEMLLLEEATIEPAAVIASETDVPAGVVFNNITSYPSYTSGYGLQEGTDADLIVGEVAYIWFKITLAATTARTSPLEIGFANKGNGYFTFQVDDANNTTIKKEAMLFVAAQQGYNIYLNNVLQSFVTSPITSNTFRFSGLNSGINSAAIYALNDIYENPHPDQHVVFEVDGSKLLQSSTPNVPTGLVGKALASNDIKIEFTYSPIGQDVAPTIFNVYHSDSPGGAINYITPKTTITYSVGVYNYNTTLTGLSDGDYIIGVRASNAGDEEDNTNTITVTSDGTGPTEQGFYYTKR